MSFMGDLDEEGNEVRKDTTLVKQSNQNNLVVVSKREKDQLLNELDQNTSSAKDKEHLNNSKSRNRPAMGRMNEEDLKQVIKLGNIQADASLSSFAVTEDIEDEDTVKEEFSFD